MLGINSVTNMNFNMSLRFIVSLFLGLIAVNYVGADCKDRKYGKCDEFEGMYSS